MLDPQDLWPTLLGIVATQAAVRVHTGIGRLQCGSGLLCPLLSVLLECLSGVLCCAWGISHPKMFHTHCLQPAHFIVRKLRLQIKVAWFASSHTAIVTVGTGSHIQICVSSQPVPPLGRSV